MTERTSEMKTTVNIMITFIFVSIFSLTIAQTDPEKSKISINRESLALHETERHLDKLEEREKSDNKVSDRNRNENSDEKNLRTQTGSWQDRVRHKRSLLPYEEVLDLESVRNMKDGFKGIYSDNDFSARLPASKHQRQDIDNRMFLENIAKDKRINTDYGYGSRLQAAENIAMDWDCNGLFGVMGPGKRSEYDGKLNLDAVKRIPTDFGYGSRSRAAEIAAMSTNGGLYGLYGPGKRSNSGFALTQETPGFAIEKRPTLDYGYGSRLQAAANVAGSASREGLFGHYGPGKRTTMVERLQKRISSDFGYGSREQAAENLANMNRKNSIFGVFGPGKRSE